MPPRSQTFAFFHVHLIVSFIFLLPISKSASKLLEEFTSIISFGGSLSDTGNLLYLQSDDPVGRYPYGETFFHHPTGRFCDGRLIIDFFAEEAGIAYLQAYLPAAGNKLSTVDAKKGMNFAVGGATAISPEVFAEIGIVLETNISLAEQIRWFQKILPSLCPGAVATDRDCKDEFKRTIFMVGEFGGNDIARILLRERWGADKFESIILPKITEAIELGLEILMKHGATTLVVPGVLPLGCIAAYLTPFQSSDMKYYDNAGCLIKYNNIAKHHNHRLNLMLVKLRRSNPQATILYADLYNPVKSLFDLRQANGFGEGGLKVCCGTGEGSYDLNPKDPCGGSRFSTKVCEDPSSYLNWDGMHLTEAAYKRTATTLLLNLTASLAHSIASTIDEDGQLVYWD